jgi:hypothetical protein
MLAGREPRGSNRIIEGRGLGIEIRHDSRNRILNTTITGITQLDPVLGMPSRRAEDTVRHIGKENRIARASARTPR